MSSGRQKVHMSNGVRYDRAAKDADDMYGTHVDAPGVWRGWFDGAIRKGHTACGFWSLSPDGRRHEAFLDLGPGTSNTAEYSGLICCLKILAAQGADHVVIRGDSQLVINQVQGKWRINVESLAPLAVKCQALMLQFKSAKLVWCPREFNTNADRLGDLPFKQKGMIK
jgi:ribonuclease HI